MTSPIKFIKINYKNKYFVYIISNKKNGMLYIGFTNDLSKRILEHKIGKYDCYTKKYNINNLISFEEFQIKNDAVKREQQMKKWNRQWKINLIEKNNPNWNDLFETLPKKLSGMKVLDILFKDGKN